MNKNFIPLLKFLIGWPFSLFALIFVLRIFSQHTSSFLLFTHLNYLLICFSLISFSIYFIFRILFWQHLTHAKGVDKDFVDTAYLWSMSEIQRYIPGNIWSFVTRAQSYDKTLSKKVIAHLLFLEILFLCISGLTISLIAANFIFYGLLPSFPLQHIFVPFIICIAMIGIAIFLLSPHTLYKIPHVGKLFPDFTLQKNITLFSFMSAAFLFFGLGTYFSISALTTLYVPHIFSLSAFFVFAYLIGYLSFITPMGLGVREAVMTGGLSKYIDVGEAAAGAIISRLILIISEVFFLFIIILWMKGKHLFAIKATTQFVKKYSYELLISLIVSIYIAYFSVTSFLRYSNFYTGRFDLGNMDQTVWNTLHGRIFQLTNPDGTNIISRLSFHADFMLVVLSPFYTLWQDPRTLLLIQSIALGVGAIFVYLIGKNVLKKKNIAFLFSVMYLINPAINHANLFDFHAVTLAVPLILAAWYCIIKNRYYVATILLLLAATTKEEIWLISGMFGIFFLFRKQKIVGSILAIFSFVFFYYIFFKAIPQAHGGNHFALSYYSDFGSTPGGVIKNIFLSPLKILSLVLQKDRLWYVFELFFPFGFFSIFSPLFLLFSGPDFAVSLLSQNNQLHNIYFHYASITVPFIILSAMYGIALLQKKIPSFSSFVITLFLLTTSITAAYWYGPLPGAKNMNHDMYTNQLPYRDQVDEFLQTIPRRYSVAATNNIGSHLSHRQRIYTIPVGIDKADVIVFLLNDQFAQPSLAAQKSFAQELSSDPRYIKVFEYQDFVLFTKKGLPLRRLRGHNFTPPQLH